MAITITVIDRPVLNVELVEGGDLTADTTYYFVGIFVDERFYYRPAASYPSEQVSITTTSTHKSIQMTWNIPNYASTLKVKWDTSTLLNGDGSYIVTAGNKWNTVYSALGWAGTSKLINSADLLTNAPYHTMLLSPITNLPTIPKSIDLTKGIPIVTITGTENYTNLITAIVGSEIEDCFDFTQVGFTALCHFYGTGTITFTTKIIMLIGGDFMSNTFNFVGCNISCLFAGALYGGVHGNFTRSSLFRLNDVRAVLFGTNDKLAVFDTLNIMASETAQSSNLIFYNLYFRQRYTPYSAENNDFYNSYLQLEALPEYSATNFRFFNLGLRNYDIWYQQLQTASTPDRYLFYDCYSDRADRRLIIYNQNTTVAAKLLHFFDFYTSIEFNIKDPDGNPVNDATITVTDNDGYEYDNPTYLRTHYQYWELITSLYTTQYELNPFKVVISKVGYQTIEIPGIIVTEGQPTIIRAKLEYPELLISAVTITDCTKIGTYDGELEITAEGGDEIGGLYRVCEGWGGYGGGVWGDGEQACAYGICRFFSYSLIQGR